MNGNKKYYQPKLSIFLTEIKCVLSESNGDNSFVTGGDFTDWW